MSPFQAEEEMNQAKNVYEFINKELKDELPALFDRSDSLCHLCYHMTSGNVPSYYFS